MFQRDRFVEDCREGVKAGQRAIREIVLEAVGDPAGIISELGEPTKAGVFPLYCGSDATVINFVWAPCMTLVPHNHNMFAVIGIYTGREDNMFWRRLPTVETATAKARHRAPASKRPARTPWDRDRWRLWAAISSIPWPIRSPS